jgi:protein-disulfide isomerase
MTSLRTGLARVVDGISIAVVATALLVLVGRIIFDRDRNGTLEGDEFFGLLETGQWIGSKSAPVLILVYSDYKCGFCKELNSTLEVLLRRYPQHVAVVVKSFVDPATLKHYKVPLGAECAAAQGVFAAYHAAAFRNSHVLEYSEGWRLLGDSAGVPDRAAFTRCVQAARYASRVVDEYEEATRLGVAVTPTSFVNGQIVVGAAPLETLDSLVASHFPDRRVRAPR